MPEQLDSSERSVPMRRPEPRTGFDCRVSANGPFLSVRIHAAGTLDLAAAPELEFTMRVAERHARLLVLDLRAVTSIDATALKAIVEGARRVEALDHWLVVVVRPDSEVERFLELTGCDLTLDIAYDPASLTVPARAPRTGFQSEAPPYIRKTP